MSIERRFGLSAVFHEAAGVSGGGSSEVETDKVEIPSDMKPKQRDYAAENERIKRQQQQQQQLQM